MTPADLQDALHLHSLWRMGDQRGRRADLGEADLSGADLSDENLSGACLREAVLVDANLRRATLYGADLRGAILRDADMKYADLLGAILRGADLREAVLRYASLSRADLSAAILCRSDLRGAALSGANLSSVFGLSWAACGWTDHGENGRMLLAVNHGSEGWVYHCGCFRGDADALRSYIAGRDEDLRPSREAAMAFCEARIAEMEAAG